MRCWQSIGLIRTRLCDPKTVDRLLERADYHMRSGSMRVAQDMYEKAAEICPCCREAYQRLWSLSVLEEQLDDFGEGCQRKK